MKAIAITRAATDGNNIEFYKRLTCPCQLLPGTICWLK